MNTAELIESRLTQTFQPQQLKVIDESAQHIGHPGAASGGGHYRIKIQPSQFQHLSLIAQHRLVNDCLKDLFTNQIHALAIEIIPTSTK